MKDDRVFFEQIPVGSFKNFAYLIADRETKLAVMVDPAWEIESLWNMLRNNGFQLRYIVNTHSHMDHIEGNQKLRERSGAKIVMNEATLAMADLKVKDEESLRVGNALTLRFIHTPGHSPESMCIQVNDFALITGDTLFIGECGRVDLPGGDANALFDSFEKIRKLDPNLIIYPGHDYGPAKHSSLGEQLKTNYTLTPRSRDDFIEFMMTP
ncbi:MAG: MBL fold metallo-hydrolase [Nitrososphaerota archaeon]|nr:MBL fold metallo-hydrolase [Nitrososphaerota archaeon]